MGSDVCLGDRRGRKRLVCCVLAVLTQESPRGLAGTPPDAWGVPGPPGWSSHCCPLLLVLSASSLVPSLPFLPGKGNSLCATHPVSALTHITLFKSQATLLMTIPLFRDQGTETPRNLSSGHGVRAREGPRCHLSRCQSVVPPGCPLPTPAVSTALALCIMRKRDEQ